MMLQSHIIAQIAGAWQKKDMDLLYKICQWSVLHKKGSDDVMDDSQYINKAKTYDIAKFPGHNRLVKVNEWDYRVGPKGVLVFPRHQDNYGGVIEVQEEVDGKTIRYGMDTFVFVRYRGQWMVWN